MSHFFFFFGTVNNMSHESSRDEGNFCATFSAPTPERNIFPRPPDCMAAVEQNLPNFITHVCSSNGKYSMEGRKKGGEAKISGIIIKFSLPTSISQDDSAERVIFFDEISLVGIIFEIKRTQRNLTVNGRWPPVHTSREIQRRFRC